MAEIYSEPYHLKITELIDANHKRDIWEFDAFEDGRNLAKIIGEPPEYPLHFSVQNDFNEWWVVLKGSIRISIDSDKENKECVVDKGCAYFDRVVVPGIV